MSLHVCPTCGWEVIGLDLPRHPERCNTVGGAAADRLALAAAPVESTKIGYGDNQITFRFAGSIDQGRELSFRVSHIGAFTVRGLDWQGPLDERAALILVRALDGAARATDSAPSPPILPPPMAQPPQALSILQHAIDILEMTDLSRVGMPRHVEAVLREGRRVLAESRTAIPESAQPVVEMQLRKLLWQRHGCSIFELCGDDVEMQCSAHCVDFRRDSIGAIQAAFDRDAAVGAAMVAHLFGSDCDEMNPPHASGAFNGTTRCARCDLMLDDTNSAKRDGGSPRLDSVGKRWCVRCTAANDAIIPHAH